MDSSATVQLHLAATSDRNYRNNNITATPEYTSTTQSFLSWDESSINAPLALPDLDPDDFDLGFDFTKVHCLGNSLSDDTLTSFPNQYSCQEEQSDDSSTSLANVSLDQDEWVNNLPTSIPDKNSHNEAHASFRFLPLQQENTNQDNDDEYLEELENASELYLFEQFDQSETRYMRLKECKETVKDPGTSVQKQVQVPNEQHFQRCPTPLWVADNQFDAPTWEETYILREEPHKTSHGTPFQKVSAPVVVLDEAFLFDTPLMEIHDDDTTQAFPHTQSQPKSHLITPLYHRRKLSRYSSISNDGMVSTSKTSFTPHDWELERFRLAFQQQETTNHIDMETTEMEDQRELQTPQIFGPNFGKAYDQHSVCSMDNSASSRQVARWTPEEDRLLIRAVQSQTGSSIKWTFIAQQFFNGVRNNNQCKSRWKKLQQSTEAWTSAEDEIIVECRMAGMKWPDIAAKLPRRASDQVRERFKNVLDPSLLKTPLTEQERQILLEARKEYGNRWSLIASKLPGRSESQIKNWWHNSKMAQRRALRRLAKEQTARWA
ncbi:hypothetical protein ACA910_001803 [Epithemia clementina (nom. ined.)]